jgi:hypothetical protein
MDIDEVISHEIARMDALMAAFDKACGDSIGFGHHSTAVVAVLGLSRVLMQLRKQFLNVPTICDASTRQWANARVAEIDDIAERLDVEATFKTVMESTLRRDSVPLVRFANAVTSHLTKRGWIELRDDAPVHLLPGLVGGKR